MKEILESKNFQLYASSPKGNTNPLGDRDDYLAIGLVGKAEYLVLIQYYTSDNVGYTKIRDFWNDPILFPEYYFIGEVFTEQDVNNALKETGFTGFKKVDFNELSQYR